MSIQKNFQKFKMNSKILYVRTIAVVGMTLALTGPFLLLTNGGRELATLPRYLWVLLPILLLLVVGAGVWMFRHESHHADDISISPDHWGAAKRL